MAEQWSRKYRPTGLESYVGNGRLKQEMRAQLRNDKMPQMLLLAGGAGTGKTTLARILAKNMVCESPLESGEACGECFNCQMLTENYILNGDTPMGAPVKDYNISNMNTVEDAERIIQEMRQIGAYDQKKVYILDEVQEASGRAQAAFLKIAEEPPTDLHIILCTTHPQKLATAFKSRFITRRVEKPTVNELVERLIYICQQEGVNYEVKGLELLVNRIGRVPREVINQAEYVSSMGDITRSAVENFLGVVSFDEYIEFINAVAKMDFVELDTIYQSLDQRSISLTHFLDGFGDFLVVAIKAKQYNQNLTQYYSPQDLKNIRKVMKGLEMHQIAELVHITRDFLTSQGEFEYYAYVFELHQVVGANQSIRSTQTDKKYHEVTQKVKGVVTTDESTDTTTLTESELERIFQ